MAALFLKPMLVAIVLAAPATAQDASQPLPIDFDAESCTVDGQSNVAHCRNPRITQGELSIAAGDARASEVGFENSEWRFSEGVRIVADSAVIEADTAVFRFHDYELELAELTGNPATFTDRRSPSVEAARGSAGKISFDYATRTLRMLESPRIVKGPNEIFGCDLIYNFNEERVSVGSADCGEPFRMRVLPQSDNGAESSAAGP